MAENQARVARPHRGYLYATLSALAAGGCVVAGKLGLESLDAAPFCFFLFLAATPMSAAWMVSSRQAALPPRGRPLRLIGLHAVLSFLAVGSFWAGLDRLNPAVASFLNRAEVLVAVLLGVVFLAERLRWIEWIGAAVAIGGIALMKAPDASLFEGEGLGFLLVLLGSVFFGLTEFVSKVVVNMLPVSVFITWRNALLAVLFGAVAFLTGPVPIPDLRTTGLILLVALLASNASRIFYMFALKELSLSRTALVCQSQPIFAAVLTVLILGDSPRALEWAGGAAILAGCVLLVAGGSRSTAGRSPATGRG